MGIFSKQTEAEINSKLPTDKPLILIRGSLKEIKYVRGKGGTEPVLIVEQNKHKYKLYVKEGLPPAGVGIGELKTFVAVEDVRVNSEYEPILEKEFVSGSVDITFHTEAGKIDKKMEGNHILYKLKRSKEKYYRLVGVDLDTRFL